MRNLAEIVVEHQPPPVPKGAVVVDELQKYLAQVGMPEGVSRAIEARVGLGMAKYGIKLHTEDGRDTMAEIMQEVIDAAQYAQKGTMTYKLTSPEWAMCMLIRAAMCAIMKEYVDLAGEGNREGT